MSAARRRAKKRAVVGRRVRFVLEPRSDKEKLAALKAIEDMFGPEVVEFHVKRAGGGDGPEGQRPRGAAPKRQRRPIPDEQLEEAMRRDVGGELDEIDRLAQAAGEFQQDQAAKRRDQAAGRDAAGEIVAARRKLIRGVVGLVKAGWYLTVRAVAEAMKS